MTTKIAVEESDALKLLKDRVNTGRNRVELAIDNPFIVNPELLNYLQVTFGATDNPSSLPTEMLSALAICATDLILPYLPEKLLHQRDSVILHILSFAKSDDDYHKVSVFIKRILRKSIPLTPEENAFAFKYLPLDTISEFSALLSFSNEFLKIRPELASIYPLSSIRTELLDTSNTTFCNSLSPQVFRHPNIVVFAPTRFSHASMSTFLKATDPVCSTLLMVLHDTHDAINAVHAIQAYNFSRSPDITLQVQEVNYRLTPPYKNTLAFHAGRENSLPVFQSGSYLEMIFDSQLSMKDVDKVNHFFQSNPQLERARVNYAAFSSHRVFDAFCSIFVINEIKTDTETQISLPALSFKHKLGYDMAPLLLDAPSNDVLIRLYSSWNSLDCLSVKGSLAPLLPCRLLPSERVVNIHFAGALKDVPGALLDLQALNISCKQDFLLHLSPYPALQLIFSPNEHFLATFVQTGAQPVQKHDHRTCHHMYTYDPSNEYACLFTDDVELTISPNFRVYLFAKDYKPPLDVLRFQSRTPSLMIAEFSNKPAFDVFLHYLKLVLTEASRGVLYVSVNEALNIYSLADLYKESTFDTQYEEIVNDLSSRLAICRNLLAEVSPNIDDIWQITKEIDIQRPSTFTTVMAFIEGYRKPENGFPDYEKVISLSSDLVIPAQPAIQPVINVSNKTIESLISVSHDRAMYRKCQGMINELGAVKKVALRLKQLDRADLSVLKQTMLDELCYLMQLVEPIDWTKTCCSLEEAEHAQLRVNQLKRILGSDIGVDEELINEEIAEVSNMVNYRRAVALFVIESRQMMYLTDNVSLRLGIEACKKSLRSNPASRHPMVPSSVVKHPTFFPEIGSIDIPKKFTQISMFEPSNFERSIMDESILTLVDQNNDRLYIYTVKKSQ